MEVLRVQLFVMSIIALALASVAPSINAEVLPPAPAPTSDGMLSPLKIIFFLFLFFVLFAFLMIINCYLSIPIGFAGIAVDQGIAYLLMLLALVLTYIIH
ncbi:Arabinogalactan peptide 20 [Spatholobus suberectus]|nr:Arabinogalactan peptide 20 [Spatholobus suberectus]